MDSHTAYCIDMYMFCIFQIYSYMYLWYRTGVYIQRTDVHNIHIYIPAVIHAHHKHLSMYTCTSYMHFYMHICIHSYIHTHRCWPAMSVYTYHISVYVYIYICIIYEYVYTTNKWSILMYVYIYRYILGQTHSISQMCID